MIARWVQLSRAYPGRILALAGILAALGAWGTVRLYGDLRPDITELLPQEARSVHDMHAVSGRVGGWASDTIILHGAPAEAMRRFADDLAAKLQAHVPTLLKRVEYRVDDLTAFFHRHRWLFPPLSDLQEVHDRLQARLAWERQHANPLYVGLDDEDTPPGFDDLRTRLEKQAQGMRTFGEGYYTGEVPGVEAGSKQEIVVLLARIAGTAENFDLVKDVDRAVRSAVAELNPERYAPSLQVAYAGDVASAILEHDALAEDLTLATLGVIVIVGLSLAVYYRTWKAIFIVGLPLMVGTLITFGIAELVVGHLNSNTAFLGSIIIGNGINVGLVFFARYLEERRRGTQPQNAMVTAIQGTYLATLTASFAAGISYASLMTTQSRGFSQFGLVGFLGMALCWIAAYALMPAVCMLWENRAPLVQAAGARREDWLLERLARTVERGPRLILLGSALLLGLAMLGLPSFLKDPIENDFSQLRNRQAMLPEHPGWWDERVDMLFGDHLTPTVLMCHNEAEAREVAAAVLKARDADPNSSIGTVVSAGSFLPTQQAEKLQVLHAIGAQLTPEAIGWIPASARRQLDLLRPPADLQIFGPHDLPDSLQDRLTETDGRFGTMVLLYPKAALNVWDGREVLRFAQELRGLPLPRPDIPTAGSILVFADMLAAMNQDGPKATLLSLGGVALLVLAMFISGRKPGFMWDASLVLATLLLGVLWFVGMAAVLHLKVNMLNFIAFPITFGIGADYATNLVQRRRQDTRVSMGDCLRTTGGAVALCSWTTIVGYGSLLVARNQALTSFGLLAVLGEVACLAAALWPLAAYLQTRWQRGLA